MRQLRTRCQAYCWNVWIFIGLLDSLYTFCLFPSWLKSLPRSGGWMNSVKVVLGFIVLAFSLKFLLTIDQSYNLNFLSRDIYLAIWIVIFTLVGLYLLGKIKFKFDSDLQHVGVLRLFLAITSFTFVVYLIPGMFGAPLKAISGLIPPQAARNSPLTKQPGCDAHRKRQNQLVALRSTKVCRYL